MYVATAAFIRWTGQNERNKPKRMLDHTCLNPLKNTTLYEETYKTMTDHFTGRGLGRSPKSYNCEGVFTNSYRGADRSGYSSTRTGVIKTATLVVEKKKRTLQLTKENKW